jgi:hypothetical protein
MFDRTRSRSDQRFLRLTSRYGARAEMRGQRQRHRVEARLELAVVEVLQLEGVGQHHVVALQAIGAVNQLPGVVLEELSEELAPPGLARRQLHHPDPQDHHGRCIVHHHLGVLGGPGEPQVGLDLHDRQAAAPRRSALHVFQ